MKLFQPTIYQKSIFDIDYEKLKKRGIKCLVFDLDNTLGNIYKEKASSETKQLIKNLRKDFEVLIYSNNFSKRVKSFSEDLEINSIFLGMKPFRLGLARIQKKYQLSKNEMCIIGDQLLTDVLAGNRYHITTILVDPLEKKDLKIAKINRLIENRIIRQYQKRHIFERGKYYE